MRSANRLLFAMAITAFVGLAFLIPPSVAWASPGTCTCNSGCHESPGQCLNKVFCSYGYVPSCGYRSSTTKLPDCPKVGYISCDGTCTCIPIPGFCDTFGDADYCDAGPTDSGAKDTWLADTWVEDTSVIDTFVPDVPEIPDTDPPPDTTPPPDTAPLPDTTPPPDTCVPTACPPGTKAVAIPGECDPYCAQPCSGVEFKCSGVAGTECADGFCVPKCLLKPCPPCMKCALGTGSCFDDGGCGEVGPDAASDAVTIDSPGGSTDDASVATSADASVVADSGGEKKLEDPTPGSDLAQGNTGGCGCRTPSSPGFGAALCPLVLGASLLALSGRRRR